MPHPPRKIAGVFPHCVPYVNIVGVKSRPMKYRVTTTDNGGNTEIRDLPGLELARFVRNARQDLWQCSHRHSLQELGTTWWVESILEAVDPLQQQVPSGNCASKSSNCWELPSPQPQQLLLVSPRILAGPTALHCGPRGCSRRYQLYEHLFCMFWASN